MCAPPNVGLLCVWPQGSRAQCSRLMALNDWTVLVEGDQNVNQVTNPNPGIQRRNSGMFQSHMWHARTHTITHGTRTHTQTHTKKHLLVCHLGQHTQHTIDPINAADLLPACSLGDPCSRITSTQRNQLEKKIFSGTKERISSTGFPPKSLERLFQEALDYIMRRRSDRTRFNTTYLWRCSGPEWKPWEAGT